jgi:hypothetical protein
VTGADMGIPAANWPEPYARWVKRRLSPCWKFQHVAPARVIARAGAFS